MTNKVYSNPVDTTSFKIFSIFDAFRNSEKLHYLESSLQVVLLFVSLYKDGLINEKSFPTDFDIPDIKTLILNSGLNEETKQYYLLIIDALSDSLSKVLSEPMGYFSFLLLEIERETLRSNFAAIIDDVIYRVSQSQGRYAGEFIQPLELTRFMCGLANLKTNMKVFNPFAGLASFSIFLNQSQEYFGQELNKKTWALGALRMMAYEKLNSSRYVCDDSISNWPIQSEKFDVIFSNPPFGLKLGHQYRDIEPSFRTIEQFLIEKGIQSLKQNGKLIALLPQNFLFRGMQEQRLRKYLIEEDLIDTIISLPGGLLLNTGIPLIIVVLSKTKATSRKIKFVDAKKYVVEKGLREKRLNDYDLNSLIHSDKEDVNAVRVVDIEQIRTNDYNLSVTRYFKKKISGVKLGDILKLVRGQKGNLPETGKLVRIRDLKDDKINFTLDASNLAETEFKRHDIHLISESCLLLAIRWKTLKPTFFEFKGEPIFRGQDILSFELNDLIADKAYLINELHTEYVQEQLESYRLGSSMPFIRRDDLMEVVIKLPSLQEQRAKVQGISELSDKIKSLQKERNALAHGKARGQFSEFASLKHTLGRPRQNILDWSDNLLDFLNKEKKGFVALNKAFSEFYEIDIISALSEIKRDVNFITDVLEKGENGLVLSEFEKQIIPLTDINNVINNLSNNGFKFKIKKLLVKGEKLKDRGIYANETLFKTILDNILTNANKYAFDKKAIGNEVVIELTEVDDFLTMEIGNNGKPFPKNFDREKFITKYSTADSTSNNGSGLGGYDIHRIATDFNNTDWVLSLNQDPFFSVKFKFQFPIKLIS
ncbi:MULTISPECIES: N-6 DNA methylase [Sphingobacterium]|uniref:site-specific DNA-methyltransferase (adenine-specific) n=1 Tax=Sphingobacterium multivorum TaxID=28454 RepID=A0A2X2LYF5_SPHMU|nr:MULTISPECIES: N-6 DNA methylase [Sphingobacterium]QRQ62977.1 N-6 DNA methylase [Sphingobacterium multivorum]SPZ94600.1 Probable type I restriction enzyme BthVORF4518P M protein [Sphingobacterium multivorum]